MFVLSPASRNSYISVCVWMCIYDNGTQYFVWSKLRYQITPNDVERLWPFRWTLKDILKRGSNITEQNRARHTVNFTKIK